MEKNNDFYLMHDVHQHIIFEMILVSPQPISCDTCVEDVGL